MSDPKERCEDAPCCGCCDSSESEITQEQFFADMMEPEPYEPNPYDGTYSEE